MTEFRLDITVTMPRRTLALCRAGLAALLAVALGAHAAVDAPAYPNTRGFGVDFNDGEEWYLQCMRVAHLAPSRAYAATPGIDFLPTKATERYYRKRGQAATTASEWRQVRESALALGDDAVLMMLHANGYGTARDADRALYHACRLDTAKAEMEARVEHLAAGAVASDGPPFDLCDHITSGRMAGVCTSIDEARADRVRRARLDQFAASLAPGARAAFARLRKAADAFAEQSENEVDLSGSGRASLAYRHVGKRHNEFQETVFKVANGKLARVDAAQFARLDRQLNAYYRQVLVMPSENDNHPERLGDLTVTRDDVRNSERAWIAYRNAWSAYLGAARASVDLVSVQAELTRQRIAQLKELLP